MGVKLGGERLFSFYKEMLFYRRFEERVLRAYTKQMFAGFCHVHIGQEAVCAGVSACLNKEDYVLSGYRSHTQALAKGLSPVSVFAELLGKETGCARGKGGSMHMFSKEHGFLGGNGIVGAQAPVAIGAAFSLKYQEKRNVAVCYLGDAAMNQGAVFEAMNMAAAWSLPVLFIIENNQYGMGTHIKRVTSVDRLFKRAHAFDMKHSDVDGMDVVKVYKECSKVISEIRETKEPYLLEVNTYRYKGHSVSDPGLYRTKEELKSYEEKDPLLTLAHTLKESHGHTEASLKELDKEIKNEVKKAEEEASSASGPQVSEALTDVYSGGFLS